MSSLSGFLASMGARSTSRGEWEFATCPWCGYSKTARFNIDKLVGICYHCNKRIFLRDLAKDVAGIPLADLKEYVENFTADTRRVLGFQEAMLDGLLVPDKARAIAGLRPVNLPDEFRLLEDGQHSVVGQKAIAYMTGRGFRADVLFGMGFGYCATGRYRDRVVIPFYEGGVLVYWQARDFTGRVDPKDKIKNPDSDSTKHGKSDVLFNYDAVVTLDPVIMTESWGSALATGKWAFAINGKSLSEVQLHKVLGMRATTVVVLLDAGTQAQSWGIAQRLHSGGKKVLVCNLLHGDPADVPHHVLLDTVRDASSYSADAHLRALAASTWR